MEGAGGSGGGDVVTSLGYAASADHFPGLESTHRMDSPTDSIRQGTSKVQRTC